MQTIFYTLPRLSELAEDEWISLSKFDRFTDVPLPVAFQWYHSRTELRDLKPSDWSQQDMGKIEQFCIKYNYLYVVAINTDQMKYRCVSAEVGLYLCEQSIYHKMTVDD